MGLANHCAPINLLRLAEFGPGTLVPISPAADMLAIQPTSQGVLRMSPGRSLVSATRVMAAGSLPLLLGVPTFAQAAGNGTLPYVLAQNALPSPEQATTPNPTPSAESSPSFFSGNDWVSTIKLGVEFEAGVSFNPAGPANDRNFGQLFTDHANQAQLNQTLLTLQRTTDPKATGYDFGFKVQFLYGSDARYTHFLGELDQTIGQRYQLGILEANVTAHLPWITSGGLDVKAGQYPSPLGYENIDPSTNPFYSHSYISQFGVPFEHTGVVSTLHLSQAFDLWIGIDSGEQTSLAGGDNNGEPAGIVGFGLNNLLGGKLNILVLSHLGPENPTRTTPNADNLMRYENDVVMSYNASDKWSFNTEVNYERDEYAHDDAYGVAQYAAYGLSKRITLNGRAEIFRDNKGYFVSSFPGNLDYVRYELGFPANLVSEPGTTYSEFTVGMTYKPSLPHLSPLMIRPEIRWDRSLSGTDPFRGGHKDMVTLASDVVLGF
jgi:putative OmpL-like beta-barrel porin-2